MLDRLKIMKDRFVNKLKSRVKSENKKNISKELKKIYIMIAANYSNLGDLAITEAQETFLKDNYPNYEIIEINVEEVITEYKNIKKNLNKEDVITLIGGGNNGDLYEFIESKRRFILREFKKNKIISFPQSVYYQKDSQYQKEFIKLVKSCKNISIFARENLSYQRYIEMGLQNVYLVPDIVFYLDKGTEKRSLENRDGVALILRKDKEKSISQEKENQIIELLRKKKEKYEFMDTCDIAYNGERKTLLRNYLKKLSHKRIAITDRLHGMILCYITNTPCIVIDNNNHKISSTFSTWLANQNFIKIWDEKSELKILIDELQAIKQIEKDDIMNKYKQLQKVIGDNSEKF